MPERHFSDEEVHQASGKAPRVPPATPMATCLRCNAIHPAFYATQAHDCVLSLSEDGKPVRKTYAEWLILFQRWGWGVLQGPDQAKFPFDKIVTARVMLTQWLQSNLSVSSDLTIDRSYYEQSKWHEAGLNAAHTF